MGRAGWALVAGFVLAAAAVGNIYLSLDEGGVRIAGRTLLNIRVWQAAFFAGGLGYLLLLASFRTRPVTGRTVLVAAVLLRIPLLLCQPNNDCSRYIWEGRIQNLGFNPYAVGPNDPRLEPYRDDVWASVNKKHYTTIYPPLAEMEFRLCSAVAYHVRTPQILHTLLDVAVLLALARLLAALGRPAWYLAIYALSPLTLAAFAHAGHNDTLMLLTLIGFVAAARSQRWRLAGPLLGLAILAKTVPAILLGLLLRRSRLACGLALVTVVLGYLFYADAGWMLFDTLRAFPSESHFNNLLDELRHLANKTFGNILLARGRFTIVLGVLAGAALLRTIRPRDVVTDTRWLIAVVVLALPIIHFWYLTWPLALIALDPRGYRAWLVLAVTFAFYWQAEAAWLGGGRWRLEFGTVCLIWIPFIVAWITEAVWERRKRPRTSAVETRVV